MTQQDILAKYKGKPPSMRVHLHKAHFRINDSQETLPYQGPMHELITALRRREVPHNMLDDLYAIETPFYDDCLIVEVHDYRSTGVKPKDEPNSGGEGSTNAFSIHNYNHFITPSPGAPYPSTDPDTKVNNKEEQNKNGEAKEDKENMPVPGQNGAAQKQPGSAKVYTVVLFPTMQSLQADIELLANTPMPDAATLKRMQAAGRVAGVPPTPLSAVPPTPTFPTGPSPKRQKMYIDDNNLHEFEAEVYNATCPKLYLEPTKSLQESQAIMDAITHPNNKNPAPARKTRKRTTAELAADEAEAQDLQRFMLAGDEQQATMGSTATGNDEGVARAAANSQTFSRFKTIATIRANHEEAERRKKEEEAQNAAIKRQAQLDAEAQKRRDMEANRQQAEIQERQQQLLRQQQQQQAQLQQNQIQQNEALRAATAAAQHQMSTATTAQLSQTPQSATQPRFSPGVRQQTPMGAAASPHASAQATLPVNGTPMISTASNHGIASPARPPSTVSHHPNQQMARSVSQQQNTSRTGTPQVMQGTPVMNTPMPNRNMTPTPSRLNQASPPMATMPGQTPMMMNTPQPGQNMTPEAMQQMQAQQRMQQLRMQQLQAQGGSPGNTPLQQLAIQKATMHITQQGIPPGQNPQAYRQQLAQQYFRQLSQGQQQQAMQNMSAQGGMQQSGVPQQQGVGMNAANMTLAQMRQQYQSRKQSLIQTYGGGNIPPQFLQQMQQLEMAIKTREQAQQQAQMQQLNAGMPNQMNGMQNMQNAQNVQNPVQMQQMQQYQQMLQNQRQQQARQQQMMAMQQRAMAQGGQIPQGMMNNMQGMNMGNMGNMQAMQGMQGMNMAQMNQMQAMQGSQGMQGMNMNMNQMNQQQMQQMMQQQMMRQAQAQAQAAQRMGQPGQQGGGDMSGWNGV